jgi:hypothetical protein
MANYNSIQPQEHINWLENERLRNAQTKISSVSYPKRRKTSEHEATRAQSTDINPKSMLMDFLDLKPGTEHVPVVRKGKKELLSFKDVLENIDSVTNNYKHQNLPEKGLF